MNEGHSAFLAIERIRLLMANKALKFEEALEATRANNVFTTHTSVPAGIDLFDSEPGLRILSATTAAKRISRSINFWRSGRKNLGDIAERFSMAVSRSRRPLPQRGQRAAPRRCRRRCSRTCGPSCRSRKCRSLRSPTACICRAGSMAISPGSTISTCSRTGASGSKTRRCGNWCRRSRARNCGKRTASASAAWWHSSGSAQSLPRHGAKLRPPNSGVWQEVLDPDVFTIGFARRFATYKRATLLFRDVERLKRILNNPKMPVQIVIAGKAHPKDHPAKR